MSEPTPPPETLSYSAAAAELEEILEEIESGTVDIDVLTQKAERAAALIVLCREKLAGTEMKVTKVIEGLEAEQGRDANADDAADGNAAAEAGETT